MTKRPVLSEDGPLPFRSPHWPALPKCVVDYLDRLRGLGVEERYIEMERDAWIMLAAQVPHLIDAVIAKKHLIPTRANGQPAFGCYLRDPRSSTLRAAGVVVLTLTGDRITAITRFVDNSLLPAFGLPRSLRD